MDDKVRFECLKYGEESYATCPQGLMNDVVRIKTDTSPYERTDLSHIIKFHHNGYVNNIRVFQDSNCKGKYKITVNACGPEGILNWGYLYFMDQTGKVYSMSIYLREEKTHELEYESEQPKIVMIKWSNTD